MKTILKKLYINPQNKKKKLGIIILLELLVLLCTSFIALAMIYLLGKI